MSTSKVESFLYNGKTPASRGLYTWRCKLLCGHTVDLYTRGAPPKRGECWKCTDKLNRDVQERG